MRIAFQCTFEDFKEALAGQAPARRSGRAVLVWIFLALALAAISLSLWANADFSEPASPGQVVPASTKSRILWGLLPSVVLGGFFAFFAFRTALRPPVKPWEMLVPGSATFSWRRGLLGWMLFAGAALFIFVPRTRARSQSEPQVPIDWLFGVLPWVILLAIGSVLNQINNGPGARRRWEAQPALHRPYLVEATNERLAMSEPLSRHEYEWSHLAGFKETTNLLVLYLSPLGFWMIPKRAFVGPDDLALFKGMLLNHVRRGTFLQSPASFPVVPLARVVDARIEPLPPLPTPRD